MKMIDEKFWKDTGWEVAEAQKEALNQWAEAAMKKAFDEAMFKVAHPDAFYPKDGDYIPGAEQVVYKDPAVDNDINITEKVQAFEAGLEVIQPVNTLVKLIWVNLYKDRNMDMNGFLMYRMAYKGVMYFVPGPEMDNLMALRKGIEDPDVGVLIWD